MSTPLPSFVLRELLESLTRGDDGIYGDVRSSPSQSVEFEMRERDASSIRGNLMFHISNNHSIEVMDYEVLQFLKKIPENGLIVDIGGCWGWHWRNLQTLRPDVTVFIVDFSRSNLLRSRDILGDAIDRRIFLCHSDATDLVFPAEIFDGVWTSQVFQHIPDFEMAIREAYRVLRPGGTFVNYSLNVQPHIMALKRVLGRNVEIERQVDGFFWLALASSAQVCIVESVFKCRVTERWSEILFSPEFRFRSPGRLGSWLGKFDALLSNNFGFLGWFARQRSFHCDKT